jgi:nucleoid-associated protein YgaU
MLLAGCDIVLPVKEMADAKSAISLATHYQAETYAKEELDAASKALLDCHEFVKNGKEKEAKDAAVLSKTKADAALAKSLPLLSKAALDDAKKALADAKAIYSDELAVNETKVADELIASAGQSYTDGKFIPAYDDALKGKAAAERARDAVLARIPALQSKVSSLENEREVLKAQKAGNFAPNEMAALDSDIAAAKSAIEEKKVKEAISSIDAASALIPKINTLGASAAVKEKIDRAETVYAKAAASPYAESMPDEMKAARDKIDQSKSYLGAGQTDKASASADESTAMLDSIMIALEKKDEEAKLAASQQADQQTQPDDQTTDENDVVIETYQPDEPKDQPVIYVVKWRKVKTDCLWRIAEQVYKDARLWPLIYVANRAQIKDPDLIYPGQKFVIPPAPKKGDKANKPVEQPAPADDTTVTDQQ